MSYAPGGFLDRFTGNGNGNGENPLEQMRARIQARVAEARTRMEAARTRFMGNGAPAGQLLGQMPRLTKLRSGGLLRNIGQGRRFQTQTRPPGMETQDISPTSQVPALADDVYSERLRAESSPGLSVSL